MTDQHAPDYGFRRRETAAGVAYAVDKGFAGVVFQLGLMFFGALFAYILGFV